MGSQHGRRPPNPQNVPKSWGRRPPPTPPHKARQSPGCCSYTLAARALARRRWRLAARYVRMDVKARLGVI